MKHNRVAVIFIMLLIIVAGLFFRVWNLGTFGFWTDELYHALAARGIVETGSPVIPPGYEYTRSLGFTTLVAGLFHVFGESEFTARLPSVFFNVLFIVLSSFYVRQRFNTRMAMIYAIFMSISPLDVYLARSCRMYSLFELLYFFGLLGVFHALEGVSLSNRSVSLQQRVGVGFLGVILLAESFKVHSSAVISGTVLVTYASILFLYSVALSRRCGGICSVRKYVLSLCALLMVALVAYVCKQDSISEMWGTLVYGLESHKHYLASPLFYWWQLTELYGVLPYLYPFAILLMIKEKKKFGLFIGLCFVVQVILCTFVFPTKENRYILNVMPFMVMAIAFLLDRVYLLLCAKMVQMKVVLCSVILLSLLVFPSFVKAVRITCAPAWSDYKAFHENLATRLPDDAYMLTNDWEAFCYYFHKEPDGWVRVHMPFPRRDSAKRIKDVLTLNKICDDNENVYLITRLHGLTSKKYFDKGMESYLQENFYLLEEYSVGGVSLYKKRGRE